jgi:DNA-binding IclR family transcriptional regulator
MKLAAFSDLPARPADLSRVRAQLALCGEQRVVELVRATGLTRNAVLVSLNELLNQGIIVKNLKGNTFSLNGTSTNL